MKKIFIFVLLLLMATGCVRIDNSNNYKEIAESIVNSNTNRVNVATKGYEYYLPKGVSINKDLEFNQIFKIESTKLYMYVDIVSYYYKNSENNNVDGNSFDYYEVINTTKRNGYVAINKEEDDKYFIRVVIDYARVEAYSKKSNISSVVSYAVLILDSIKYNDKLIEKYIVDNKITSSDVLYKIKKPEDSESKFNQYLQEYVDEEVDAADLPDE